VDFSGLAHPWAEMGPVIVLESLEPDLLLLDLSMPKHSGMEALQELSKNKKNGVRVIVLTAAIETSEIVKALQPGACGVVMKAPVTEVLLTAIQTVMAGRVLGGSRTRSQPAPIPTIEGAGPFSMRVTGIVVSLVVAYLIFRGIRQGFTRPESQPNTLPPQPPESGR
jgi:hypothetical protein